MAHPRQSNNQHRSSCLLTSLVLLLMIGGSLLPCCVCAPALTPLKNPWHENDDSNNVPGLSCDPATGRCWDLVLPVADARDNYVVEQNEFYDRAQPIHARAANQQPASGGAVKSNIRHTKKDMFMSRGWGAGGMPFSVLYMKPRTNHSSSSSSGSSGQAETSKNTDTASRNSHGMESLAPSTERPSQTNNNNNNNNNRLALRNNSSAQPRRHYSIIPQLFISYGWGPSGK